MKKGEGKYNVIVIGAGTAGLVTAAGTAGLGGHVALIERDRMGGDCLNTGCVPSKALIASTRRIAAIRGAAKLGLKPVEPDFDFNEVFQRMRDRRAIIEPHDSQERFESLGVNVFRGDATFIDPHSVDVNGTKLTAANIVIATGGRAGVPPIEGIDDVPYHTNETIFDQLKTQPRTLAVIGGGPIGCELSQAFQRLGTQVTILETLSCIMSKEDPDVASFVKQSLSEEGVDVRCSTRIQRATKLDDGGISITYSNANGGDESSTLNVDALLIAAGRKPNIENLGLDKVGVNTNQGGVVVNQKLQTSQPNIFAAGDVTGTYQFTHWADAQARIVIANIVKPWFVPKSKIDDRVLPWVTYIEPEVAHVGLNETQAKERNIEYDLYKLDMKDVDRAILADEISGFIKVLAATGKDRILGVTIVANHGGDLLHEFVLAMKHNIGLAGIANTVHAYPTMAEIAGRMGDQYQRTRLSPLAKRLFGYLYRRARR